MTSGPHQYCKTCGCEISSKVCLGYVDNDDACHLRVKCHYGDNVMSILHGELPRVHINDHLVLSTN